MKYNFIYWLNLNLINKYCEDFLLTIGPILKFFVQLIFLIFLSFQIDSKKNWSSYRRIDFIQKDMIRYDKW